jgi:hypothetical protein
VRVTSGVRRATAASAGSVALRMEWHNQHRAQFANARRARAHGVPQPRQRVHQQDQRCARHKCAARQSQALGRECYRERGPAW